MSKNILTLDENAYETNSKVFAIVAGRGKLLLAQSAFVVVFVTMGLRIFPWLNLVFFAQVSGLATSFFRLQILLGESYRLGRPRFKPLCSQSDLSSTGTGSAVFISPVRVSRRFTDWSYQGQKRKA